MTSPRTRKLKVRTSLFSTKIAFIGAISTVIFAIALPNIRNTTAILTSKLRCSTRHISALKFIAMISAVVLLNAQLVNKISKLKVSQLTS